MSRIHSNSRICGCAAALLALLLAGAAAAEQPEDAWITTQVKMKLLAAERIDALGVNVDTYDGRVTLHGKVDAPELAQSAELAAREVDGVREVRNLLVVVDEAEETQIDRSDDQLREQVSQVLERDKALESSEIRVKSVNAGTVVLAGEAETLSAHRRAMESARSVDGVKRVASEIHSPNELGDREIWSEEAPGGETTLGAAASDGWITAKVKMRLIVEPGVSPTAVNVDTRDGVVTLFGPVETEAIKQAAAREAEQIDGVRAVENELQVVPDVAAGRVEKQDDQIRKAVDERLQARDSLRGSEIGIEVSNGVVRLTGTVKSFSEKLTALTVARSTEGVDSIVDDLRVREQKENQS